MELFKLFGSIGLKNKEANKAIDETVGKAEGASGKIANTFKKMVGILGGLFAGKAIFDFGKSTLEAAASAKAMKAQFESVFGELVPKATETVNKMSKAMGILPERLNPMFTSLSSKYKGLGASTEEAMDLAARGTTLAADAAAFYDKSLEDTSSALNSFINGNYEGGEAIGLFANETQLASWASDNLGVKWKDLDEKGKQVIRLQFAEAMQKAAGATGQASREADGYENVIGNLKAAWEKFKAVVGGPILEPVVNGLMGAVEWMQKAGDWVSQLYDKLESNGAITSFKSAFDNIKSTIDIVVSGISDFVSNLLGIDDDTSSLDTVSGAIEEIAGFLEDATGKVKDFINWFKEGGPTVDALKSAVVGVTTAWTSYKVITGIINGIETAKNTLLALGNGLMLARFVQSGALTAAEATQAAATMGATGAFGAFNAVLSLNPIMLVVGAIAALVAGLVWFFTQTETGKQIWQGFMDFLTNLWNSIVTNAPIIWQGIVDFFVGLWNGISSTASSVWNAIAGFLSGLWSGISSTASSIFSAVGAFFSSIWQSISGTASSVWNGIKSFLSNLWNGISSTASSIFNGIKDAISNTFNSIKSTASSIWNGIKSSISNAIDGAKNAVSGAINKIKSIMNFSWKLPHLKLPRITIDGEFSLMPPRVPSFGLSWHAKGGIMSSPTLFGFDGNNFHAGGEAGDEAILPLNEKTLRPIGQQIADSAGLTGGSYVYLLERIIELLEMLLAKSTDIYIDREKISQIIYEEMGIIARREA
ncbi:phage tail protein [Streptococcus suis]|uniref:phage tail protein n=1 Tax=Streptococcus suis TaxID=1307 RepID=UPI001581E710|nr:phage tail tape measure protein [Streptococcus suis]MCG9862666.1 phage tail tape measure protein [Streptococcus suis]MCG9883907.1 phage tail tape measure protein [Streptococcus suis]HEM6498932.1 phage tail tape measure protein [Streptococcus suis]